jgi:hypothetical protein
MIITARIIGAILLVLWLVFIPVIRRLIRAQGQVMHSTVFQFNILPFIVGVGLIASGNLWFLVVLPVAGVLSVPFQMFTSFFMFHFPLISGWVIGAHILTDMFPDSKGWYWGGGAIGAVVMLIVCSIVTAIVTAPPRDIKGRTIFCR